MKNRLAHIFWFLLPGSILLFSCNPTRKLQEGEALLDRNTVVNRNGKVEKADIESYIKQKPNRKVLLWRVYLHIYNSVDQEKLEKVKARRSARRESYNSAQISKYRAINEKREAKGKSKLAPPLRSKTPFILREWWKSNGEPPVIYDSMLTKKSARQIKLLLNNKGYFNSQVKDSVILHRKTARPYYLIREGRPYTLRNISYEMKDEQLNYYVLSNASSSVLKRGMNYDVDRLQKERDRITDLLRNEGYYQFSKEYIYFEIDSALGTHEVDVTLGIKNTLVKTGGERDTVVEVSHSRYYMNNIYVYTDHDPRIKTPPRDSLLADDYYLLSNGALRYKPRLILDALFISKGELFQQMHADQTYRRLSELKMFRSVQLQFVPVSADKLDCFIYLSNMPKQSFSVETEGTNTSGTLGVAGNLVYQNKNVMKGGEIFEWKLKGALEVQKTRTKEENLILTGISNTLPFNTLELGTETNLIIPRFLLPFHITGTKSNNAKTNFSGTYNFQRRPDFGRSLGNVSFGYLWKETVTKQHLVNPIEFNLINLFNKSPELQQTIDDSNDPFLKNSYSDHFTLATRYAFVFNNQEIHKKKNFSYMRIGAEGAGNTMRGVFNLLDQYTDLKLQYQEGGYMIDSIKFSQYLRFDIDYRYYRILNEKDRLVYRAAFGVGKPLHNLRALPLEKSFFAGGPNSVRAWESRTLGPGGYFDSTGTNAADKIGDAKIEGNFEYRFNVLRALNAAMFIDAGNIWLRKPYSTFPDGEFTGRTFIGQIAIGAGMGFRLDFNFFIIRLDGAFKLKDPALPEKNRWTFGKQPIKYTVFNFGIGYPF